MLFFLKCFLIVIEEVTLKDRMFLQIRTLGIFLTVETESLPKFKNRNFTANARTRSKSFVFDVLLKLGNLIADMRNNKFQNNEN